MDSGNTKFQEGYFEQQGLEQIIDMLLSAVQNQSWVKVTIAGKEGEVPQVKKLFPVSLGADEFVFTDKVGDPIVIKLSEIKMVQQPTPEEVAAEPEIKKEK